MYIYIPGRNMSSAVMPGRQPYNYRGVMCIRGRLVLPLIVCMYHDVLRVLLVQSSPVTLWRSGVPPAAVCSPGIAQVWAHALRVFYIHDFIDLPSVYLQLPV